MKRSAKVVAAAVLVSAMAISQAWALNINNLIKPGANNASDEDRESLINRNGGSATVVDVGDSLRGIINFNTVNSSGANLGGSTGNDEFTGIFQVIVTAIGAPNGQGIAPVTLAPDPAFAATLTSLGVPVKGGEVIALFTSPTINFCADRDDPGGCNTLANNPSAFEPRATDGTFWATFGFRGGNVAAPGEGIAGDAPKDIALAAGLTSGSAAGNINIALSLLTTGPGFGAGINIARVTPSPFGGVVDLAASQQLRGISDLQTPFQISSNTNVSFNNQVIPEPSTVMLFGVGLVGLGILVHRRKKQA